MKRIIAFLVFLCALPLWASPVDSTTARRVADAFRWRMGQTTGNATMQCIGTEMYVFNYAEGFVVVSADDAVTPVLGFAAEGSMDINNMLPNVRYWLSLYAQAVSEARKHSLIVDDNNIAWWKTLRNGAKPTKAYSDTIVGPFLTTHWGQDTYYNNKCPVDQTAGARAITGCVATAMGQIMRYWNHPVTGTGSHNYTSSRCGTVSADFGNTAYDWANMPASLGASSSTAQVNAVATLLYHCGVATDMNYGATESGTYTGLAAAAFRNNFGYSPSINMAYRSGYNDAQWCALVKRELDMGRPMLYSGSDASQGGHAFVCDGYRTLNGLFYFSFKWGWKGQSDAYWTLAPVPTGSSMSFTVSQEIIYNIEPATMLHTDVGYLLFHGSGDSKTLTISSTVGDDRRWTLTTNVPWLSLSHSSGEGDGMAATVTLTAQPNTTGRFRFDTLTLRQGSRYQKIVVQQMVESTPHFIYRTDSIEFGETGYHTYMDTLFFEDFNSDNLDCWTFDAGANCLGYSPVTRMCWQKSPSFCKDAYEGLSLFEPTNGVSGNASFAKSPYFKVIDPSRTTVSMMLYDEGVIDDVEYYDEAALIYSDANRNGYVMSITNTDVEVWTHKSAGLHSVTAGDIRLYLGHANSGGVGMGVDNLLVYGPRRINIPPQLSSARRGAQMTSYDTVYRVGCAPTVISTQWSVRGMAESDTVVVNDTVVIEFVTTDTLYIHDTVLLHDTVYLYDTVVMHDTVCPGGPTGVVEAVVIDAKIYSEGRQVVVEGAEGAAVMLYDVHGRCLAVRRNEHGIIRFDTASAGVYMVRIGGGAARKVVVM